MGSYNRVIVSGNLGSDPEVKTLPSGKQVANLSVACNEQWKDAQGQKQERVEWVRVVCWEKTAELVSKYLRKGAAVLVEGRLQTRKYEKDGQTHYATDVVADRVIFLGKPAGNDEAPI